MLLYENTQRETDHHKARAGFLHLRVVFPPESWLSKKQWLSYSTSVLGNCQGSDTGPSLARSKIFRALLGKMSRKLNTSKVLGIQLTSWKLPTLMLCGSWRSLKSWKGSYLRMLSFLRCHLDEDKIHLFPWLSRNDRKASEHSLLITWCSKLEFC